MADLAVELLNAKVNPTSEKEAAVANSTTARQRSED